MFRTLVSTKAIPGLTWIRSYYTEGAKTSYCVYEAESADDIARYSRLANVDYDEILPIAEMTREHYWTPEMEAERVPALAG